MTIAPRAFLLAALPFIIGASDAPAEIITPDTMRAHVEFLASDVLEGRETGTRGYDIAANYVATRFRAMGMQPASDKGWFQQVPFNANLNDEKAAKFSINGREFALRQDVRFGPGRKAGSEIVEGEVVFAGFGIDDPKNGQNDYKGVDAKGKIVAVLSGFPKGMASDIGAHYGRSKAKMAEARGAIGVITIRTLEAERTRPWAQNMNDPQHPAMAWAMPDGSSFAEAAAIRFSAQLGDAAAAELFAKAPKKLADILAEADKDKGRPKGFKLKAKAKIERTTTSNTVTSPNVIGMIPGSDPSLAGEYVLLMAHLDHNGVEATNEGDKIFNGAMDNASGTATLLEAARALASGPKPRRSVIFAAVTAEERGLLGSDYLARNPATANGKIVAVVNLDMPVLLYDFQDVVAFGAEHSTMGGAVARAANSQGIALSPDPLPAEGLFTRSDHYSFVRQGVPSVFLMTGFKNGGEKQFQDFLKTHYHKVSDDLALPIDWNAAAKFARLNTAIAAEIANAPSAPMWYSDSFFGNIFAPAAKKAPRE
jgi:Zn-dependent M28 family amino/carboxypeptidase